jgi:hypothetical protein
MKFSNFIVVMFLLLKSTLAISQPSDCDLNNPSVQSYLFNVPSFIQLFNNGSCISGDISDTTLYFPFNPNNQNGVIYWGFSSPLGFNLTVSNIEIYDLDCQLISQGQSVNGLTGSSYFVKFVLQTILIDNFCPYFLPINPLAVDFGMVEAKQINDKIQVDWITMSETNSSHFVIRYSYDLNQWYTVNKVQSSGNSSTNRYYSSSFIPQYPGTVYIRVVEYDYNGNTNLSEIIYCVYISSPSNRIRYDLLGRMIQN